ncbi:MAG: MetQ/NlpA family ABC transporter substrate-binding protein [Butyribacter sp.]|nr:MetQ/NlpA family ABC transporter substrate-binding protein [bacterium]MDY3854855.1 MetQ/NlpA family ABC transporter substrate-binding protein [Butyribacter sp.]
MKKKLLSVLLAATLTAGVFSGCGGKDASSDASTTLKVGASLTPHAEILKKAKPILEKEGVTLEIVEIEDSVTPNTGLLEGSLDANYFQHQPYLDDFNKENNSDLVSAGSIHYEPFGIYAGKTKSLDELPDGATVAVPNNVTNEARALLLLEQEGLLKLKEGVDIKATVNDIVENKKNIKFEEVAPEQLVRSLPDVDVAVINGNYAIEGGLHVKDALAVESDQSVAAKTYANIVAVQKKDKDNAAVKKLVEVLQGEEIQKFIEEEYDGAVVPIH